VSTRPGGDHGDRVAMGYLFNYLQPTVLVLRMRGSSGTALIQKVGAGAQLTRDGPEIILS
jgi:hypothetical protein